MRTQSQKLEHISGWTLDVESMKELQAGQFVDPGCSLRACGCGVKIDLDHIVYPTLAEVDSKVQTELNIRRDCFVTGQNISSIKRHVFSPHLNGLQKILSEEFKGKKSRAVVELFSSGLNFYRHFQELKEQFKSTQEKKWKLISATEDLQFAKGHSISGEVDFLMLDLFEMEGESEHFHLINNDTIITGDSVLLAHSLCSIFIALNNALNDVLIYGGHEKLKIIPVYDGNEAAVVAFKKGLLLYQSFLKEREINIEILDLGPLNVGAHLIGATVIAQSLHTPTGLTGLHQGDKVLLSHKLGDLGILSVHRTQFVNGEEKADWKELRSGVLEKLATPHFLMSRIISKFLPKKGECFDRDRHISFISDVSGPGLSVLEEAANASGVNIRLNSLKFTDERILNYPRKNYTTSTNGPWLMAGGALVMERLSNELFEAGLSEVHFIGEVKEKSSSPKIQIGPGPAACYNNSDRFKYNLFFPKVRVDNRGVPEFLSCPLFKNVEFLVEDKSL